tara:strand:- start:32 stop:184 length:153 start_codon:yes stop_codon:yes gene_type:complete
MEVLAHLLVRAQLIQALVVVVRRKATRVLTPVLELLLLDTLAHKQGQAAQ